MMLLGALWFAATAWALGVVLLGRAATRLSREEAHPLAFLAGAACLDVVVSVLGLVHAATTAVFVPLGLGALALAWKRRVAPAASLPAMPRAWRAALAGLFAVFGGLYLLHALMPEVTPDGPRHQLAAVARAFEMRSAPAGPVEAGYVLAFAIGGHPAPALVSLAHLAALAWLLAAFGRRIAMPQAGAVAAALTFLSPAAGLNGSTASSAVPVAALSCGAFYLLCAGPRRIAAFVPMLLCAVWETVTWGTLASGPQGTFGPVLLLAPLGLLALRKREGLWACAAAAVWLPWGFPALPFVALALGIAVNAVPYLAPVLLAAHALLAWPDAVDRYAAKDTERLGHSSVRTVFSAPRRVEYLKRHLAGYPAIGLAARIPPGGIALGYGPLPRAYLPRPVIESAALEEALRVAVTPALQPSRRVRMRWREVRVTGVRVLLEGPARIAEWRLFDTRDRELPRGPQWRLRASPRSAGVRNAFDNTPITAWQIETRGRLEVEFGAALPVAGLLLECSPCLPPRVEAQTASGWRRVQAAPAESSVTPPPMRRMAAQELRLAGVTHILLAVGDEVAGDLLVYGRAWGVRVVAQDRGASLLALE
jgi:hypothetical protein